MHMRDTHKLLTRNENDQLPDETRVLHNLNASLEAAVELALQDKSLPFEVRKNYLFLLIALRQKTLQEISDMKQKRSKNARNQIAEKKQYANYLRSLTNKSQSRTNTSQSQSQTNATRRRTNTSQSQPQTNTSRKQPPRRQSRTNLPQLTRLQINTSKNEIKH